MAKLTVKEWFNTLPSPYKQQALNNMAMHNMNERAGSSWEALNIGFSWASSIEGHDYWWDYYRKLKEESELEEDWY